MRFPTKTLAAQIEDLLHRQLCAWELLTVAADSTVGDTSETLRTHAVIKRMHVRELYDLLRRAAAHRNPCHVAVEACPPLPPQEDLAALLSSLECHEAETLQIYGEAIAAATKLAAEALRTQRRRTRETMLVVRKLRQEIPPNRLPVLLVCETDRDRSGIRYSCE